MMEISELLELYQEALIRYDKFLKNSYTSQMIGISFGYDLLLDSYSEASCAFINAITELTIENERLNEAMKWKSIKEAIPEQGQNILLCYPLIRAVVNDIYKRQYNEKDLNFYTVHNAYWMPIPESLKVEK